MRVEFCDTDILVYAFDTSAGARHEQARQVIRRLWLDGGGALSLQVLQEVFVTLTRDVARPLNPSTARDIVADLATWQVVRPTEANVLEAIDTAQRWQLAFGDALILTAAQVAGAEILWSEDLRVDPAFDALSVRGWFRSERG